MKYKSRAISLTYIKHGNTSIISKIFTEEKGLQTFIIKGVRSKKSKKKLSHFEPLKLLNLDGVFNKKKSLQNLSEITIVNNFDIITNKIYKDLIAFFIAEVSAKVLQENDQNRILFTFIWNTTIKLYASEKNHPNFALNYLLDLSKLLGFYPSLFELKKPFFNLERGGFSNKHIAGICLNQQDSSYLRDVLENINSSIPKEGRSSLLKGIIRYYKMHYYNLDAITSHLIIEKLN